MNTNGNGNNDLTTRAMLVGLEINLWGNRRLDKKVGREVAATYGVGEEIGRYNKWLLIENEKGTPAKEYQAVVSAANAARQEHYQQTLPWDSEGDRILTAANFMHWASSMREQQNLFNAAFQTFYDTYPALVARSEHLMNNMNGKTLFNAKNYPDQSALPGKFGFSTKVRPLPAAADFRVELSKQAIENIRFQIEADLQETVVNATEALFERLGDVVKRVAHLGNEKSVLRRSLAEDVRSVCAIAARLNLNDSPVIEGFRSRIEKELSFSIDTLKAIPEEREALAARADQIMRDMSAYMGTGE